jgi:hypothetical protein
MASADLESALIQTPEILMNRKLLSWTGRVASILAFAVAVSAQAQGPVHFTGSIHDYTPSTVKLGPWELHGNWTLDVFAGKADLVVDMTMSNYGTPPDPANPGQTPHVHHVVVKGATVQWNMNGCPAFASPTNNTFGFQFTSKVNLLTGNGQPAPFDPAPPQSPVTVCVTGVTGEAGSVAFSNITLEFGTPASSHFGVDTVIHGVVANPQWFLGENFR